MVTKTPRAVTRRRNSPKGKGKHTNLRFDQGKTSLDPTGVTPSRRVWTIWEKRTHRNSQNQSKLESEGQARRPWNHWPNKQWTHNHRDSQPAPRRAIAKQQMRPGEDSPPAKLSDKPGKSAATIHQKWRQTERGRRYTTTRTQNL